MQQLHDMDMPVHTYHIPYIWKHQYENDDVPSQWHQNYKH